MRQSSLLAPIVALALILIGCSDSTQPEPDEAAGRLVVELPAEIVSGEPFEMSVVVIGEAGTRPFKGYSGEVALNADGAELDRTTVNLIEGTGSTQVTLTGTGSPVTIAASGGGVSGQAAINALLQVRLPGDAGDPAMGALPSLPFSPRAGDYAEGHSELAGDLSFNTLMLVLASDVTVGQANVLLTDLDALIVGHVSGGPAMPGVLTLRLPTVDHAEMATVITQLRSDERITAVLVDELIPADVVSEDNGGDPSDWTWQVAPGGGNWGLEQGRVPQMWNLVDTLRKGGQPPVVATGVLDDGFATAHPDGELIYLDNRSGVQNDHGSHVSGTIGATFDNAKGIDGVNPFAVLVVDSPPNCGDFVDCGFSSAWRLSALQDMVFAHPDLKVVNMSIGRNWHRGGDPHNPGDRPADEQHYAAAGLVFGTAAAALAANHHLPLIVNAAGNCSDGGIGLVDARFNTDAAYAGLVQGLEAVLVVEAVRNDPGNGTASGASRAASSNIHGHISAPGEDIRSTTASRRYDTLSGTSMAAPFVTGVIGFLYAVDPGLTHAEVRELLLANGRPAAGGASDCIDAFAAVMDIDRLRNSDTVLRMLLDVDDGTADGNQRKVYGEAADYNGTDADGDGGPGDGHIDMADFRCWRDAYLQTHADGNTFLDGSTGHLKRDLNGDGTVGAAAAENVYPRCDFNGDGIVDDLADAAVPGRVQDTVTDLEVLEILFDDPHYAAADLVDLVDSGDIVVDAADLAALPDYDHAVVEVRRTDNGELIETRELPSDEPLQILTVPWRPSGYDLTASARNAGGDILAEFEIALGPLKGEDKYWKPSPEPTLLVLVNAPGQVGPGTDFDLEIRAGLRQASGDTTYQAGLALAIVVTGGSAAATSGQTDADGNFTTTITPATGVETVNWFVTATWEDLPEEVVSGQVIVGTPGALTLLYLGGGASAGASSGAFDDQFSDAEFIPEDAASWNLVAHAPLSGSGSGWSSSLTGDGSFQGTLSHGSGLALTASGTGTASASLSGAGEPDYRPNVGAGGGLSIQFTVSGSMNYTAGGSVSSSHAGGLSYAVGRFMLTRFPNVVIFDYNQNTSVVGDGSQSINASGILPPGTYTLTFGTTANAIVDPDNRSGSANASGSVNFTMLGVE